MKCEYLENGTRNSCYGCSMCEKSCPTAAIKMEKNSQGFLYPTVDKRKCIDCGKCHDVCPYTMEDDRMRLHQIYQAAHKNTNILMKSQSGGAFSAISDYILQMGGVVYGAVLKDDFTVEHMRATNEAQRDRMHGSKYVQSYISPRLIAQIELDILEGKMVLFTGCPCQCAMIQKKYGKRENLQMKQI